MANRRVSASVQRGSRSSPSHRTKKQTTTTRKVRRSARLQTVLQHDIRSRREDAEATLSSTAETSEDQAQPGHSHTSFKHPLKRKRSQEALNPSAVAQDSPPAKRPRKLAQSAEDQPEKATQTFADPLSYWVRNRKWPREYFEADDRVRGELLERDSWADDIMAQPPIPVVQYVEINGFRYPLPVKKTPTSLRRKQSDSSLNGSSDQKNRESKSVPYRDLRYATLLAAKGSYMDTSDLDITNASRSSYKVLLSSEQTVPTDSLFRDDVFKATCRSVQDRNEFRIIHSISPYIVPSAEHLAIMGATKLKCLIENVNEGWTGSIPVEGPRPQPDYSIGFRRSAFTQNQSNKLDQLIGSVFDTSFFVATYRMYFPFLTCEVKCGGAALDVADRQNAHSMTIAVRSVVELYKAVKREKELNREILAFSISHDHRSVRIYGHYAVIDDDDSTTTFYRHPIKTLDITSEEGKDKWTAYKFTKNVYDIWMPTHLKRVCSAIDQLPSSLNFEVSGSEVRSEAATGLSQDVRSLLSDPDNVDLVSQEDGELNPILQTATPDTSVSQAVGQGAAKRARKPAPRKNRQAGKSNDESSNKWWKPVE